MAGLSDILTAIQNGVTALNNLGQQTNGSLLNISGQLASARVKIQFNARDMTLASGNISYTGIGFRPSLILFFGTISTSQSMFIGADNGVTDANSPRAYLTLSAGVWATTGASSLFFSADNGVTSQEAKVASFDIDGFTLTWTKTGAPAAGNGFFQAFCFK